MDQCERIDDALYPKLLSLNPLPGEFSKHSVIHISKPAFSIGRSLNNSEVIACVSISRLHCVINYTSENDDKSTPCWKISDSSRYGILVNGNKLDQAEPFHLKQNDIIQLDLAGEFVYKFSFDSEHNTRKRKYSETFCDNVDERIQEAKDKFDSTQTFEIDNMKNKINIVKRKQCDIINEKQMLEKVLKDKFVSLENDFQNKLLEVKGKHEQVEKQKEVLRQQNEEEKRHLKIEMNNKIAILEGKIKEQKANENILENENKTLLERLAKEREDFERRLCEIVNVKEQKLEDLESQLKQKEQELMQEKMRMESLRLQELKEHEIAKEQEIKILQSIMQAEQETKLEEIESLKLQMQMQEHMSKETRKIKEMEFHHQIEKLKKEAEEIRIRMMEENAMRIAEQTEQETVRMAAIEEKRSLQDKLLHMEEEKQKLQELLLQKSKQSEEEIKKLQREQVDKETAVRQQFEKEKQQLVSLLSKESESCNSTIKQMQHELLEAKCKPQSEGCNNASSVSCAPAEVIDLTLFDGPSTSSGYISEAARIENDKCQINRIMDAELQCSICSDLFIEPVTLNCTHTFCKYCIEKWKNKKKECPVCRSKIVSQFRTIILESLITSMVETLGKEAKERRAETVKERQDCVSDNNGSKGVTRCNSEVTEQQPTNSNSDVNIFTETIQSSDSDSDQSSDPSNEYDSDQEYASYGFHRRYYRQYDGSSEGLSSDHDAYDSDNGSYNGNTTEGEETGARSRLSPVEGLEGFYYGGYGRCYKCHHPGHWAPGCPFL